MILAASAKGVERGNRCEGSNPSFSAESLVRKASQGFFVPSNHPPLFAVILRYYPRYYRHSPSPKMKKDPGFLRGRDTVRYQISSSSMDLFMSSSHFSKSA